MDSLLEPKFALRLAFGALSGQLARLGRSLVPGTEEAHVHLQLPRRVQQRLLVLLCVSAPVV